MTGVGDGRNRVVGSTSPALCSPPLHPPNLLSSLSQEGKPPLLPASEHPSRDFPLQAGWRLGAAVQIPEAVRRCWPSPCPLLSGSGWSRPAHCTASTGKEVSTAQVGEVLWGPGSPQEPTSSLFSSAWVLLPSIPFQPEPLEGSLTVYSAFFQRCW